MINVVVKLLLFALWSSNVFHEVKKYYLVYGYLKIKVVHLETYSFLVSSFERILYCKDDTN